MISQDIRDEMPGTQQGDVLHYTDLEIKRRYIAQLIGIILAVAKSEQRNYPTKTNKMK